MLLVFWFLMLIYLLLVSWLVRLKFILWLIFLLLVSWLIRLKFIFFIIVNEMLLIWLLPTLTIVLISTLWLLVFKFRFTFILWFVTILRWLHFRLSYYLTMRWSHGLSRLLYIFYFCFWFNWWSSLLRRLVLFGVRWLLRLDLFFLRNSRKHPVIIILGNGYLFQIPLDPSFFSLFFLLLSLLLLICSILSLFNLFLQNRTLF